MRSSSALQTNSNIQHLFHRLAEASRFVLTSAAWMLVSAIVVVSGTYWRLASCGFLGCTNGLIVGDKSSASSWPVTCLFSLILSAIRLWKCIDSTLIQPRQETPEAWRSLVSRWGLCLRIHSSSATHCSYVALLESGLCSSGLMGWTPLCRKTPCYPSSKHLWQTHLTSRGLLTCLNENTFARCLVILSISYTGQVKVPFGDAVIATLDTVVGCEVCHELFVPRSPHTDMALQGVEIFVNGSGSHHELRKLTQRINLITQVL